MIINPSNVQSAYQATAPKAANPAKDTPTDKLEFRSFESLLSDSDKRTLAAMDKYAVQNGIPEDDLFNIKSIIGDMKAFALDEGKELPINQNLKCLYRKLSYHLPGLPAMRE